MWDFTGGHEIAVSDILDQIIAMGAKIDGITLLGGEPLDQYEEVLLLLQLCAKTGLSTMLFTGYELWEVEENGMSDMLRYLDILITGRYKESERTLRHQWIGSINQGVYFLTSRYSEKDMVNGNYMEITVAEDGSLTVLGFPPEQLT